jgi:membrane-associated protease RseP (regulator of RpoE activity)
VPAQDEARTYRQKTFGQRVKVAVAGSAMHFMLALVLIFIALVMVGQPGGTLDPRLQGERWSVGNVIAGSGAAAAGLHAGDKIVSIDGRPTGQWDDVRSVVQGRRGETVAVVYERNGQRRTTEAELRPFDSDGTRGCCLGVEVAYVKEKLSPVQGITHAPLEFGRITSASLGALGQFFSPSGLTSFADQVADAGKANNGAADTTKGSSGSGNSTGRSGSSTSSSSNDNRLVSIVGVVRIGSDVGAVSPAALVALFALVNISLGMINLFPLLPLDGGHVAIAVYEKVQEKRLRRRRYFADVSRLLPVTYAFILVLGVLAVSTIYLDLAAPLSVK